VLTVTPQERLALGVTALLLTLGAGARILAAPLAPVEWQQKDAAGADTDREHPAEATRRAAAKERARERVRGEPLADGERIDPSRATADEIDRLPRVGPALAGRIVAWRTSHGPFRTLAELDSVPGVGPTLLAGLAPHLTLPPAPAAAKPAAPAGRAGRGSPEAPGAPLDLNGATAAELDALPGIGPVLARRLVEWREANGPFRSIDELEKVPGIGPSMRRKLAAHLRVGP
jgi:competence ComEA-like helix-hairpin-helix protein